MRRTMLEIAEGEIGIHEIRGGENPRILEYDATTTLCATEDEVPWCSSFVNWCAIQAGYRGTNDALAKSWLDWGRKIDAPVRGCVCVVRQKTAGPDRATGSATGYHVALWLSEKDGWIELLGGNQSDSVKISHFKAASYEICGYRLPVEN